MTHIPPGITLAEVQAIADQRDKAQARVTELERLLRKVRDRAVSMDPFTLNEVNEALKG